MIRGEMIRRVEIRIKKSAVSSLMKIALLTAVGAVASSCSSRPDHVLGNDEMSRYMADLQLAEAYSQSPGAELPDSIRRHLSDAVRERHGISPEDLDSTLSWYGRNMDEYFKMLEATRKIIAGRRARDLGQMAAADQGNDLWPYGMMSMLSPYGVEDGMTFHIPAEGVDMGEIITWRMRLSSPVDAELLIGVDYADGGTVMARKSFYSTRSIYVDLLTDTARRAGRIFGTLTVDREKMPLWVDSLSLRHLPFDSTRYYLERTQTRFWPPAHSVAAKDFPPSGIEESVITDEDHGANRLDGANRNPGRVRGLRMAGKRTDPNRKVDMNTENSMHLKR